MTTENKVVLILGYNDVYDEFHEGVLRALSNNEWSTRGVVGNIKADNALAYFRVMEDEKLVRFYGDRCIEKAMEIGTDKIVVVSEDIGLFKASLVEFSDSNIDYVYKNRIKEETPLADKVRMPVQQLGYYETLRVIQKLSGERYYIANVPSDSDIVKLWSQIKEEKIMVLKSIWSKQRTSSYRHLFEVAIPMIAEALNLREGFTYQELYVSMLEYFAEKSNMSRLKTYAFEDFREAVVAGLSSYKKEQPIEIALELLIK